MYKYKCVESLTSRSKWLRFKSWMGTIQVVLNALDLQVCTSTNAPNPSHPGVDGCNSNLACVASNATLSNILDVVDNVTGTVDIRA